MKILKEIYCQEILDTGVYQTYIEVDLGDGEVAKYKHDIRLWSDKFVDEIRGRETYLARRAIMDIIRMKLFGEVS